MKLSTEILGTFPKYPLNKALWTEMKTIPLTSAFLDLLSKDTVQPLIRKWCYNRTSRKSPRYIKKVKVVEVTSSVYQMADG